jgi:hypothetical protein
MKEYALEHPFIAGFLIYVGILGVVDIFEKIASIFS